MIQLKCHKFLKTCNLCADIKCFITEHVINWLLELLFRCSNEVVHNVMTTYLPTVLKIHNRRFVQNFNNKFCNGDFLSFSCIDFNCFHPVPRAMPSYASFLLAHLLVSVFASFIALRHHCDLFSTAVSHCGSART